MEGNTYRRIVKLYLTVIVSIVVLGSPVGRPFIVKDAKAEEDLASVAERLKNLEEKVTGLSLVPIGTIMPYGGSKEMAEELTEKGWIFCDGRALSRRGYKELYSVIGTAFGVDGNEKGSFKVPDLRGRFVRGVSSNSKRDPDANDRTADYQNGNTGNKVGSVQDDEYKKHTHKIKTVYKHYRSFEGRNKGSHTLKANKGNGKEFIEETEKRKENDGGKETRPKNIYVNWIIKAK